MGAIDISTLSADERLHLLDRLWDSLSVAPESLPVTAEQRAELDRRLDDVPAEDAGWTDWDELAEAIRTRAR